MAKALLPPLVPCRSSTKVGLKDEVKQEDPFLTSVGTKPPVALTPTSQFRAPKDPTSSMLLLKRTSKAHTSPDAIIHQDSPVHSTASEDVHCGSKCTSEHHDLEISVSDKDETCIASPAALLDQRDVGCFDSYPADAPGVGYKHSTQYDIKSSPPDEVGLNSPPLSVCTISPQGPLSVDKLARVKSMSSPHNLCIRLDADEEEKCLLGEESVHEYMAVPLITQDSIDQSPNNAQSLSLSKGLVIPMSHDENAHHVDSHNPYRVPPPTSKAKLSPTTSHFLRT